ncbi:NAD(P)H-dependent glycerol-3-phosphate dehydrogenase [bacterium]|nr:NAD(P)H-dependent glycerol-3-phosphate dehydrogenase [bacterium]
MREIGRRVSVIGAGAWGTALSQVLARNGHDVLLWAREKEVVDDINTNHTNSKFLKGSSLSSNVRATGDMEKIARHSDIVLEAIPVAFIRGILREFAKFSRRDHRWIVTSKGLEIGTNLLPSQIIDEMFSPSHLAVLAGPTFACEVVRGKFSTAMLAVHEGDEKFLNEILSLFSAENFVLSPSYDPIGVQVGGAYKNILALTIGVALGANLGDNAMAALMTKGLEESAFIIKLWGGRGETVYGLAGAGDLILTMLSPKSKNMSAGMMLGQGRSLEEIKAVRGVFPESFNTVDAMLEWAERRGVRLLFCEAARACIDGKMTARNLVDLCCGSVHAYRKRYSQTTL